MGRRASAYTSTPACVAGMSSFTMAVFPSKYSFRASSDWPNAHGAASSAHSVATAVFIQILAGSGHENNTRRWPESGPSVPPVNGSALHHQAHLTQRRDAARGITVNRDQIGEQAFLHLSDPAVHMQHARGNRGGALEGRRRRHPVLDHQLELARVVA